MQAIATSSNGIVNTGQLQVPVQGVNHMLPPNAPSTSQAGQQGHVVIEPKTNSDKDPLDSSEGEDEIINELASVDLSAAKMQDK